jgi:hypothetical protein
MQRTNRTMRLVSASLNVEILDLMVLMPETMAGYGVDCGQRDGL